MTFNLRLLAMQNISENLFSFFIQFMISSFSFFQFEWVAATSNKAIANDIAWFVVKVSPTRWPSVNARRANSFTTINSFPCHKNHYRCRKFQGRNWKISRFEDKEEQQLVTTVLSATTTIHHVLTFVEHFKHYYRRLPLIITFQF